MAHTCSIMGHQLRCVRLFFGQRISQCHVDCLQNIDWARLLSACTARAAGRTLSQCPGPLSGCEPSQAGGLGNGVRAQALAVRGAVRLAPEVRFPGGKVAFQYARPRWSAYWRRRQPGGASTALAAGT